MGALDQLQSAGFSPAEIERFATEKRTALTDGGFSGAEIDSYLGARPQKAAGNVFEAIQAGWEGSATGLMLRNKLPDVVLDRSHSKWYERAAAGITQMAAEAPEMVAGAYLGGAAGTATGAAAGSVVPGIGSAAGGVAGGLVGAGAGAFAVPAAIREAYVQALTKGHITSTADFLTRSQIVLQATGKEALVGGLTFGAGGVAARLTGKAIAPSVGTAISGRAAVRTAETVGVGAELGTMIVAPAALEGRMPEPQDFLDAAILLGGAKGAVHVAGRLANVYAKTGRTPDEVLADATKEPSIALDLKPIEAPTVAEPMVTAYHGSPHEFTKFDVSEIGTGEGAQTYGHGLYFAENEKVALNYKRTTSDANFLRIAMESYNQFDSPGDAAQALKSNPALGAWERRLVAALEKDDWLGFDYPHQAIREALRGNLRNFDPSPETLAATEQAGHLYKVEIPQRVTESMLDWDKPLDQQPASVKAAVAKIEFLKPREGEKTMGQTLKRVMAEGDPENDMRAAGIPGIKYLDHGSRAAGKGTNNFVVFDHKDVRVIERNGARVGEVDPLAEYGPRIYQPLANAEIARSVAPDMVLDDMKIAQVLAKPFGDVPLDKTPNYLNMKTIEGPQGVREASARISEVFGQQIEEARGKESWEQTKAKAADLIRHSGVDPETLDPAKFRDLAANLMAKNAMAQRASFDVFNLAKQIEASGGTDADFASLAKAIEVSALTTATFQGDAASVARAMNAIKAAKQVTELGKGIEELQAKYGEDPRLLARMIGRLKDSSAVEKFAKDAAKATTYEKVVEAWKAAILSGPITHIANLLGNTTFMLMRPVIDAAAVPIGMLLRSPDRVTAMEPVSRLIANMAGFIDAMKFGAAYLEAAYESGGIAGAVKAAVIDQPGASKKTEQFRPAIEGAKGHVIRLPFRALSLADALFKTMNEQGEKYALATRQATGEGINPLSREFRERIAELSQNPDKDMQAAAEQAGLRYTFNMPLGEAGLAVQSLVRKAHLELIVPFVRTPGNIAKELARMTPFAPLVGEWRNALASKGPERDRAVAELALGTAAMGAVAMLALNDTISGQGSPDPNKRKVMMAAGWQPYSIKIGDTYYNYQRLQPAGTLIGLAADLAEAWDYLDTEEADKIPKILSVAFANAVTNQTFLQGITNIVNAASDPTRFGPKLAQQYAGSIVPGLIAQPVQMTDPVQREVNSMLDAIRARLPGREGMLPKRDTFGEPVATKDRLAGLSPITETHVSEDKVRTEAARLGLSIGDVPKKIHVGRGSGKLGEVELTPEQKNKFQEVSGKTAHEILDPIVNSETWDSMPRMVQQRIYKRVFLQAHKVGAIAALPPEERGPVIQHIIDRMEIEMAPQ